MFGVMVVHVRCRERAGGCRAPPQLVRDYIPPPLLCLVSVGTGAQSRERSLPPRWNLEFLVKAFHCPEHIVHTLIRNDGNRQNNRMTALVHGSEAGQFQVVAVTAPGWVEEQHIVIATACPFPRSSLQHHKQLGERANIVCSRLVGTASRTLSLLQKLDHRSGIQCLFCREEQAATRAADLCARVTPYCGVTGMMVTARVADLGSGA